MDDFLAVSLLVALVLMISALTSGLVERAPISFPIIFLGLGFLLGERGFNFLSVAPGDPLLESVGLLTLALVLFLDAVKLSFHELRREWQVPMLALGPGTLGTIAMIGGMAYLLLGVAPVQALLLGAILASTDPVVLRDVVRDKRIPRSVRRALSVEAGTNDLVVLPVILVLIAVARAEVGGVADWARFLVQLLVVSPVAGFAAGAAGAWLMSRADDRFGIRREHQALYGIGLVLAAYVAGQSLGGDGLLSSFAAGFAVAVLNFELCDCFLEYGETSAEMAMLLVFVLFGALLSSLVTTIPFVPALLLGLFAIGVARPLSFGLVLQRARLSASARLFIGWFGPRGLNSLLLALLLVRGSVPDAERLLAIVGSVVLLSVVAHGVTATPLTGWYARRAERDTLVEERESTAAGLFDPSVDEVPRISVAELAGRIAGPDSPVVLDVRSRSTYHRDGSQIPGSVRVLPDEVAEWAELQPRERPVVAYCT